MPNNHAIVWMDSREASVFRFGAEDVEQHRLQADAPFLEVHHKAGVMGAGRPAADLDFFDRVIDSLRGTRFWSLLGPDRAKDYFIGYLDKYKTRDGHIAGLRLQLADVSSVDRLTDGWLIEHARRRTAA